MRCVATTANSNNNNINKNGMPGKTSSIYDDSCVFAIIITFNMPHFFIAFENIFLEFNSMSILCKIIWALYTNTTAADSYSIVSVLFLYQALSFQYFYVIKLQEVYQFSQSVFNFFLYSEKFWLSFDA